MDATRFPVVPAGVGVFVLLILAAFSVPAAGQATVPILEVGREVGYGATLDLTALAAPFLDQIRQSAAMYNITSIQELSFTGALDAWVHQEVLSHAASTYVLGTRSAEGIEVHAAVNVTFDNLPAPGVYNGIQDLFGCIPPWDLPSAERSVEVRLDLEVLVTSDGTSRWTVSDYALLGSTDNATSRFRGTFLGRGIPQTYFNATECKETVSYEDMQLSITADTTTQLRMGFSPALDVYDFPIADEETWYANGTATIGATVSGTVDVGGITAEDEEAFFENLTLAMQAIPGLAATGLDSFPLNLAEIQITMGGVPLLADGVLHDQTQEASLHLRAREAMMTLGDGQLHPVYRITPYSEPVNGFCSPTVAAIYSPDDGMIVGLQVVTCLGDTEVPLFEMRPVPPGDATDNIGRTQEEYVPVAAPGGNAFADFFLAPPFLGLLLLAAAVIIVAVLLFRRRGRPLPPGGTQGPPPGPP